MRLPYSRWSDAVLNFLRDVCEPYLRIFRRFIPPIGMFDLSPMIAIIVLYIVRTIVVNAIAGLTARDAVADAPRSDAPASRRMPGVVRVRAGRAIVAVVVLIARPGDQAPIAAGSAEGEAEQLPARRARSSTCATPGSRSASSPAAARSCSCSRSSRSRCWSATSRCGRTAPWLWLPTGLLIGGALGNLIDRLADGAVTDFIKLPLWPAFNVADMAITFGVLALLYVLEGRRERCAAR